MLIIRTPILVGVVSFVLYSSLLNCVENVGGLSRFSLISKYAPDNLSSFEHESESPKVYFMSV